MELKHDPTVPVVSRQAMRTLDRSVYASVDGVRRGAYVLADPKDGNLDVIIMATGTEVALAVAAFEQLSDEGVRARVVSMPSWNLFERQDEDYRESKGRCRSPRGWASSRRRPRLGPLRRPDRHRDRDAVVRHVGAAEGPAEAVRLHARGGGRCRHAAGRMTCRDGW